VLGLFFALPPPLLTLPIGDLLALVILVIATSAFCLGAALLAVTRIQAGLLLREP
jgi:putative ABC transport system permease protein